MILTSRPLRSILVSLAAAFGPCFYAGNSVFFWIPDYRAWVVVLKPKPCLVVGFSNQNRASIMFYRLEIKTLRPQRAELPERTLCATQPNPVQSGAPHPTPSHPTPVMGGLFGACIWLRKRCGTYLVLLRISCRVFCAVVW